MIEVKKILYITDDGYYIHCTDSALEIRKEKELISKIPPTAIKQIVFLSDVTISNYLIKFCNEHGINVSYVSKNGNYYGRVEGTINGNVLLRKEQYLMLNTNKQIKLVQNILLGKFLNSIDVINGMVKNSLPEDKIKLKEAMARIKEMSQKLFSINNIESLIGLEGQIAAIYYSVFDNMLKSKNKEMMFVSRSKRPAENNINALLSLIYTLATRDCVSALEGNGLDSYCGYLHSLRSGRESLACDLVEEFRAEIVDKFVIKNVNLSRINANDFERSSNSIRLKSESRKKVINMWSEYKEELIDYPYHKKKYPIKLLPYIQAQLMAEYIRGDIDEYVPWCP